MPKLWSDTIEAHRRDLDVAIVDTTARLVASKGLRAVTMSEIASETGIGRATLYKYYPDVESILVAWHDRHVASHLGHLRALRDNAVDTFGRLEAVLSGFARIAYERSRKHSHADISSLVHHEQHVAKAQQQVARLFSELLSECVEAGQVRDDIPVNELANYCLHTLSAARTLSSSRSVERLVVVTMTGLRPQSG